MNKNIKKLVKDRYNYYGQSIGSKCGLGGIQDLSQYWPTDKEFEMMLKVAVSDEYNNYRKKVNGEKNLKEARDQFPPITIWIYFVSNLQKYCKGYTIPLTENIILECLKDFENEKVVPWLKKEGKL